MTMNRFPEAYLEEIASRVAAKFGCKVIAWLVTVHDTETIMTIDLNHPVKGWCKVDTKIWSE